MRNRTAKIQARSAETKSISLHQVVRRIREAQNLSGAELCRMAGDLDPKTLTAVEKGRIKNPSIHTLMSIAKGLGISISDLFKEAELETETNLYTGTQKGAFQLDFPKKGVKIISFTPFIREFFCGKLLLAGKKKFDQTLLSHSAPFYFSMIIGRIQVEIESKKIELREGDNLLINGAFEHRISNLLHREAVIMVVTAPSFLGKTFK